MQSPIVRRPAALALLAAAAVLLAALLIAPRAEAATIYSCQKKKGGTIRIVTSKTKCKKTEKKIKWSTTGAAGKNGKNGTNGSAGTNGAPGAQGIQGIQGLQGPAGPGATRFAGSGSPPLLGSTTIASFSVGGVDFRVRCGNALVVNAVNLQAKSATETTVLASGIIAKNPTDPGAAFQKTVLTAGADYVAINASVGNASGPEENQAVFTYVLDTGTKTVVVQAGYTVLSTCTAAGWAVPSD